MHIIRPITENDTERFIEIAFHAGIGMTSIPKNRQMLKQRVMNAIDAFSKSVSAPGNENYLFVLEDLNTNIIGGICGIDAKTGIDQPLSFYRIEETERLNKVTNKTLKISSMRVVHYSKAPSEICSLYLLQDFRHGGLGRLLSFSRFLFIAAHRQRFDKMVFAEMRGYVDEKNTSPFWEGIGRHFLNMQYEEIMHLRDEIPLDITEALPEHPIYIHLLPKEVQDAIGKVHVNTLPALSMLVQEGFNLSEEIDVFDGGPKIEVETSEIRTIKSSRMDQIAEITNQTLEGPRYIVSNERLEDFRACFATIIQKDVTGVIITSETAEALQLGVGDAIRYVLATE